MPRRTILALALFLSLAFLGAGGALAEVTIKMATLVPTGSVWDKVLKDMGSEWQESTDGNVGLRIYAGGVAGDEPDVVRKMRIGQLHAASITTTGLTFIDQSFEIFEIPMFFASYEELFHVLERMRPLLEERLRQKGFVLLNWGHGGWVHLFSKKPVRTVEDLKQQKVFTWAGNDAMVRLWRSSGYQPVALAATDILSGLQTGMIEAVPTTPLVALSLQWFRQTPNMQSIGLAPLVGATVVTERIWKRISPADQQKILSAAKQAETRLMREIPDQDERAVTQMRGRGLQVVEISEADAVRWRKEAETFTRIKRDFMDATTQGLLDRIRQEREAYRSRPTADSP